MSTPRGPLVAGARAVGFAVAVFAATEVGRATFDPEFGVSLVWPVYGVVVLWMATATRRSLPFDVAAVAVIPFVTILHTDGSWQRATLGAVAALVAATSWTITMRRLAPDVWGGGGTRPIGRLRDLRAFVVACLVAAVLSAAIRAHGIWLLPTLGVESSLLTVVRNLSWILAICALGLLLLPRGDRAVRRWWAELEGRPARLAEVVVVVTGVVVLTSTVFSPDPPPFAFPLVLGAVWGAFRLPTPAAVVLAVGTGGYAVLGTLEGRGPFVAGQAFEGAAIAQAFVITLVLTTLAIAFVSEDRRLAVERAVVAERIAAGRAALLGTVVANLDEGISVVSERGDYTMRNPASYALSGPGGLLQPDHPGPQQPAILDDHGALFAAADLPPQRAMRGEDVTRARLRMRRTDQPDQVVEASASVVDSPDLGRLVVTTLRDVTAERAERDQLQAFAGVVAHDLKNPLTVVQGWAESLHEELGEHGPVDVPTLRSMVERVLSGSEQMRGFIDDLLAYTVAGDRPLVIEALDLSTVADDVAELRRQGPDRPRITVDPDIKVAGDRFLLRQLLDNLIGNAVKYVAPGVRPSVTVTAGGIGGQVEVAVTDNGVGIPAGSRERVFDSFVRVHAADYSGTGLGLAICERVVRRHGGRIWVDPATTSGTRISFTLPAA